VFVSNDKWRANSCLLSRKYTRNAFAEQTDRQIAKLAAVAVSVVVMQLTH